MQGGSDSQPIGGIVSPPPSVQINSPQRTDSVQAPMIDQPPMQEDVLYIQMSKFKHPTRMYGYLLIGLGTLIYLLTMYFGSNSTEYQLGCGTCCMFYNAAFVCEILFYYNMMEHNQSHGKGTGWPVINIVLAAILTVIGLYFAFGMFTSKFSYF